MKDTPCFLKSTFVPKIVIVLCSLIACLPSLMFSATIDLDSLNQVIKAHPKDTSAIRTLVDQLQYIRGKNLDEAKYWGEMSINYAKISGDFLVIGHAHNNHANTLQSAGEYDAALKEYQFAIKVFEKANSRHQLGKIYMNIGSVYLNRQNTDQAEKWLLKAQEAIDGDTPAAYKASLFNNLALVASYRNDHEKAIQLHKKSLKAVEISGKEDFRSQALSYNNIGYAFQHLERYPEALQNYRKGYQFISRTSFDLEKAYIMSSLVDGLMHTGHYAEADRMADSLRTLAQQLDARNLVAEVYKTMAAIYEQKGKYQNALEQYTAYIKLHDSLLNEDQNERIAALQNQLEVAEKDAEIEIVSREKEMEAARSAQQQWYIGALVVGLFVAFCAVLLLVLSTMARKKANRELQRKNKLIKEQYEALQRSNERLEDLNREKDGLIGIVAHDLKSPLNKSSALTDLIASVGPINEAQAKAVEMIRKVTAHGNDLIRDLLDLNSIEHSENRLEASEIDLKELFHECAATFEAAARAKDIHINWHVPSENNLIQTDRKALHRILENLVSNAIKFSPRGKSAWVEASFPAPKTLLMTVRDEGPGISSEDHKNLFKKFQRLSARPTGGESSTGLGLAITKTLAEKLGGQISVQSKPGMGAEFRVTLPRACD